MSAAGGPERDPDGEARAWDDIVRRLRDDAPGAGEEPDPSSRGAGIRDDAARADRVAPDAVRDEPPGAARGAGPEPDRERDPELDEDLDDDWEPEDPGDVTAGMRPGTLVAWGVLLGVSAVLLILGFVLDGLPWWLWFPGLALILGSLVSLFQALPEERSEYDDGAQV